MEKFYSSRKLKWRNFLSRTLLVLITVLVIVWALPRNESKQFRYDIGKPWMYGSFIAKFDFPIYKTDEAIKEQEDSLLETYQPYYNYDPAVEKKQVSKFLADYQNGIPGLPHNYVRLIADRLHRLYQAGIMDTPEYNEAYRDSTSQVRLVSGNSAQSISLGCVYSTLSAYEQLFIDEQIAMQRPILQRCNLNNYIEPNLIYDKGRSETERNDLLSSIPPASGMVIGEEGHRPWRHRGRIHVPRAQLVRARDKEKVGNTDADYEHHHRSGDIRDAHGVPLHNVLGTLPPRLLQQAALHSHALYAHNAVPGGGFAHDAP